MSRTPTSKDVNDNLDSVRWENLCSQICVEEFFTHRVKDSNGKGNGLDAYKIIDDKFVIGYQFKKYKDKFGESQIKKLRDNITLANEKCLTDLDRKLYKFIVVFNLNLDPSHCGIDGELKQFENRVAKWAKESFDIQVEYLDLDWVHTKLLKYPHLCPELFEKSFTTDEFNTGIEPLKENLNKLLEMSQGYKYINKLIKESNIHYDRAKEGNYLKRISEAIQNLNDAISLLDVDGECIDMELKGKILICLSGMHVLVYKNNDAITCAKEAMSILKEAEDIAFCKGNWAFALIQSSGDLRCAEKLLSDILEYFEKNFDTPEVIRTLTHLLQIYIYQDRISEVISCSAKLHSVVEETIKSRGSVSDVLLSARGVIANSYMYLGDCGQEDYYKHSLNIFVEIMRIYKNNGIDYMYYKVKSAKAMLLCRMDKEGEGKVVFDEIIHEMKAHLNRMYDEGLYQILAITLFNKAFIIDGLPKTEKRNTLLEAKKMYLQIGDLETVDEIENELKKTL